MNSSSICVFVSRTFHKPIYTDGDAPPSPPISCALASPQTLVRYAFGRPIRDLKARHGA